MGLGTQSTQHFVIKPINHTQMHQMDKSNTPTKSTEPRGYSRYFNSTRTKQNRVIKPPAGSRTSGKYDSKTKVFLKSLLLILNSNCERVYILPRFRSLPHCSQSNLGSFTPWGEFPSHFSYRDHINSTKSSGSLLIHLYACSVTLFSFLCTRDFGH